MAVDPSLPELSGSVAVVTGAGGRIGSGIALRFAAAGAAVIVHHLTSAGRGGVAVAARTDLSDPGGCAALMRVGVAKAGVAILARCATLEYGGAGIRVNSVSPGLIRRPGLEDEWPDGVRRWSQRAPLGRLGESTDVGDACVFLASPSARWITGHDLVVDGGMSVVPSW